MKIKKARKIHFQSRFKERVGYDISEDKIQNIKENITKNGKFLYRRCGGTPPMNSEPTKNAPGVASHDLFSVGERFRFQDMKTVWEVLEVVERGWVVGQYLPGSPYHHGHKHLIEWSHRPNLIPLNMEPTVVSISTR
jgi:hypothetical protein